MNKNDVRHEVDTLKEKIDDRKEALKDWFDRQSTKKIVIPWATICILGALLISVIVLLVAASC